MRKTDAIVAPVTTALPVEGGDVHSQKAWGSLEPLLLGSGSIVLLLLLWQSLPYVITISPGMQLFFTTPSRIAVTLWGMFASGEIWEPLRVSASAFAIGLAMAVAVGLPLPILINTYEGVRNSDKLLINVVRSFGAGEWDIARLVVVPNALPYIVAGLRLAIGRAVLGVVVAEFFGSEEGLGVIMVRAASSYHVDIVFAGVIVFAALSLAMTSAVQMMEQRLGRWRPQIASDAAR